MTENNSNYKLHFFLADVGEFLSKPDIIRILKEYTDNFEDKSSINDIRLALGDQIASEQCDCSELLRIHDGDTEKEKDIKFKFTYRMQNYNKLKDLLLEKLVLFKESAENTNESNLLLQQNETIKEALPVIVEPKYNNKIFTSYKGFQIFEAFKNEIVTELTEYADYSFLFSKLKKDEFIHEMKHIKFIDFLGGEPYNAKFASNYKQFKFSKTTEKENAYSRYKKQFQ